MTAILDPIGACLSLTSTFLFVKATRSAWMIGLLAIIVNTILYFQKGLYGQVGLEFVYFITMIYGWVLWGKPLDSSDSISGIQVMHRLHWVMLMAGMSSIFIFVFCFLTYMTDSDVAHVDALIVAISLSAQFLLCHRYIECWILWLVVDAIVAILQWQKGIPFHSGVHFIYLGMAIVGHIRWTRLRNNDANQDMIKAQLSSG